MSADPPVTAAETRRRRPVIVTIAVVLVYISAFANVALGVLVLLSRYEVAEADVLRVSLLGAAIILFGLLLIGMASGLARGSRLSRLFATIYLAVLFVLSVFTIATTDGWDWGSIIDVAIEVLILIALWAPPGSRHFTRPTIDAEADAQATVD
ncbi:hypothetical protein IF188_00615 [Microbacterium sp. NEAU-LLC]|uniref:Uncharacterized protein n=1 Tax=Microbacterium helvum TaxID=2773713 RepID=A0ABR8NHN5_9MICO|nr:hypothetical protein [Microbacterium helvum]MBD3940200.1 hypothetical protein [Microbacterium helvum]